MRNKEVMAKVIDLSTQKGGTKEQRNKVSVQVAIISRAFGVKNDEIDKPVKDYERNLVLSDDEIRKQFNEYVDSRDVAVTKQSDLYWSIEELKNRVHYFIEGVRFFNASLADEFEKAC